MYFKRSIIQFVIRGGGGPHFKTVSVALSSLFTDDANSAQAMRKNTRRLDEILLQLKLYIVAYCRAAFFPNERRISGNGWRNVRGYIAYIYADNPVDICHQIGTIEYNAIKQRDRVLFIIPCWYNRGINDPIIEINYFCYSHV